MIEARTTGQEPNWERRPLHEFGRVVGGGTPSRSRPNYWNGSIPWASVKDFTDEFILLADTAELISQEGLTSSAATLVPKDTPVVCTRMAVGRCALTTRPTAINQDLKAFLLTDDIHRRFFVRMLRYYGPVLDRVSVGSTVRGITLRDLLSLEVFGPATQLEQSRVAAVLDVMDAAITRTEEMIAKLKQMRTGLIHDLLTRGLDEHGHVRDPMTHPQQFHESPIGWIPKEWEILRIGSEVNIEHGFAFDGHLFTDKPLGPRLLVPGNFHRDGGLFFNDENTKYFAGEFPLHTLLRNGDTLIVMTDLSPMTLILGRTVLLSQPFPLLHNQRIGKFRFKHPENWNPAFFVTQMNDDRVRRKVIREATGTTVRHTSPDRIESGFCARPSRREQDKIVAIAAAISSDISGTDHELLKLKALKSGLTADLLTGRVRIPNKLSLAEVSA